MRAYNRLAMVIFGLFFLATSVFGVEVNYETTSVSRIVGESPDAMRLQLMKQDFMLESAGLYMESVETKSDVREILKSQFGTISTPTVNYWYMSGVQDQLENDKRNFIVLNSKYDDGTPYEINAGEVSDLRNWNLQKSNIFVFDSYAAGLHIPETDTFASTLTPKATVVASLSHTSAYFVKAFVCNLGKFATIGEVFRQARNNYYAHTHKRSEFLGMTMLSYALSGIPTRKISNVNWDTSDREEYCADYDEVFGISEAGEYSIQESGDSFTREVTVGFGEPATTDSDGFTIIESDYTEQLFAEGSLVVPTRTETVSFPLKTTVSNVTFVGFEDPVDISAQLPDWNGTSMQERTCYEQTAPATAEFASTQTEDAVTIIAHLNPLEIVDCESGQFKFYKTARYVIEYAPYSPLRIVSIDHPDVMIPDEIADITVHVENTETTPASGKLVLSDSDGVISVLDINATMSSYELELDAPPEEGIFEYTVSFMQDDEIKTSVSFDLVVDILESSLDIPEIAVDDVQVSLELTNNLAEPLPVTIEYELFNDEEVKDADTQSMTLSPGKNNVVLSFSDLEKSAVSYDLAINIPYLESNEMLTGMVVTDRAPRIEAPDVAIKEGESVTITPIITDPDGDEVSSEINAPFALDGSRIFNFEESGTYPIEIEASDGILTTEKTVYVVVENVNRPPELLVQDIINGKEGESLSANATATDPDNENGVSNDDNELNITYGWPFDENGNADLNYEMSGKIEVPITVSDGEFSITKLVELDIENTNRPPNLDNLTDITIKEGEWVYAQKGGDVDNENDVLDDDNILTYRYFNVPLDHEGKWHTTYDNSGVYDLKVELSDGEFGVTKSVKLTVENVNRPPVITAPDVIEANNSVDLSIYVTDPDNTNYASNDDNVLTVDYGGDPFSAAGVWSPTVPDSTAYTTIIVSDGEFTVSKEVYVHVAAVNVPSQQTPPQIIITPEPEIIPQPVTETTPQPTPETTHQRIPEASPGPVQIVTPPPIETTPQPTPEPLVTPAQEENPVSNETREEIPEPLIGTWGAQPQTSQEVVDQPELEDDLGVEVKVKSKIVDDGDSVKVKPDDEFKVKIDVTNNAEEDKDVEVEASIDDLDQEEDDSTTLEKGDSEDFSFDFNIPRITDEDEYDLDIFVKDDEKTREWNILLKIDKPAHEINIGGFFVNPELVLCGQISSELKIKLENTGKNDEEGTLSITSETLSFSREIPFELAEGESQTFTDTVSSLNPGTHDITAKVVYGEEIQLTKQLTVESCKQEETAPVQAEQERTGVIQDVQEEEREINLQSEGMPLKDIVGIAFVALSGLFALMLVIFVIKMR